MVGGGVEEIFLPDHPRGWYHPRGKKWRILWCPPDHFFPSCKGGLIVGHTLFAGLLCGIVMMSVFPWWSPISTLVIPWDVRSGDYIWRMFSELCYVFRDVLDMKDDFTELLIGEYWMQGRVRSFWCKCVSEFGVIVKMWQSGRADQDELWSSSLKKSKRHVGHTLFAGSLCWIVMMSVSRGGTLWLP